MRFLETGSGESGLGQLAHDLEHPGARLLEGARGVGQQVGSVQLFANVFPGTSPPAIQGEPEIVDEQRFVCFWGLCSRKVGRDVV